ncbi:ATP-binding cassette domain-containing protein [Streptomyces sp. SAS_281]
MRPGQVTGFLGPNGAGTTTLRMILGLETPTGGGATVSGLPCRSHSRGLRHVGALLDAGQVHGGRTATAHMSAPARSNGISPRRVEELLHEVCLADAAGRRIGGFSLGMKQRLGVATALLDDPPVLMFDEPVNGMDTEGALWMRRLFRRLAAEGRTVFLSSHLMSQMENTADRLVVIGLGKLIAAESVREFAARNTGLGVVVGTRQAAELTAVLSAAGASVEPEGSAGAEKLARDRTAVGPDRRARLRKRDPAQRTHDPGGPIGRGIHGTHRRQHRIPGRTAPMTTLAAPTTTSAGSLAEPPACFRDLIASESYGVASEVAALGAAVVPHPSPMPGVEAVA